MMKRGENQNIRLRRSQSAESLRGAEGVAGFRAVCREESGLTSVAVDATRAGKVSRRVRSRRKRGFTLVEMVVSMALVLLVTAAVVTTVQVSYRTIRQDHIEQCAIREAENLVLCFESGNFAAGVKLLYPGLNFPNLTDEQPSVVIYFTQDGKAVGENDSSAAWKLSASIMGGNLLIDAYRNGEKFYSTSVLR